jgi:hypothetical protein
MWYPQFFKWKCFNKFWNTFWRKEYNFKIIQIFKIIWSKIKRSS